MAARKTAAKKPARRSSAKAKGVAKTSRSKSAPKVRRTRRKSTAEPKRIINRKKRTAKKATTARERKAQSKKQKTTVTSALGNKVARLKKKGYSFPEAAAELGVTPREARQSFRMVNTSGASRIVGTEKEIAKRVKAARAEGVSWPDLRARTGLSGRALREMAGEVTPNKKKGAKKTSAKKTSAKKTSARTRRSIEAPEDTAPRKVRRSKKVAGAKASARTRRSKKTATAKKVKAEDASGIPKGRRARRVRLNEVLKELVWPLDTDNDEVKQAVEGHKIIVTRNFQGREVKPTEHTIVKVKSVTLHDTEGRVIEFIDENKQVRFVSSREITTLK